MLLDVIEASFFVPPHWRWQAQIFLIILNIHHSQSIFDHQSPLFTSGLAKEDGFCLVNLLTRAHLDL